MDTTQIIGITAGVFTAASMLPQLIKLFREKKAEDVSLWMLIILITGIGLWIAYGFLKNDMPILITNCFSLLVNVLTIILSIKYKEK